MPTATSHMSARTRAGKRNAAAKRLADKSRRPRASAKSRFTLHGFRLSGPTSKVGRMLSLSGAPFSYAHVNLGEGGHRQSDHLAKNRDGQVHCLTAGKMHLCQSASILEYLADALGKFKGANPGARRSLRLRHAGNGASRGIAGVAAGPSGLPTGGGNGRRPHRQPRAASMRLSSSGSPS